MQTELHNGFSPVAAHDPAESSLLETLAHVQHDLDDLIGGLALLDVRRCSQCRQFFRSAEPGSLFECGQLICYGCISDWWFAYSMRVSVVDRERTEGRLAAWLRKYHRAEVVKETADKALDSASIHFQIVAKCFECAGSGKLLEGERCRFCNGFGTVRIVVPK